MAKQRTFQDKVAKAQMHFGEKCPKCETIKEPMLYISSEPSKHKSIRFSHRRIKVCKCNEKEVFA